MLDRFLFSLGSGLCHQIPERSFIFGSVQLPLCARCTGIYVGFFFAFVALLAMYWRAPRRGTLSRFYYISLIILGLPLVFDGLSSYLGFRSTSNLIRLLSGAAFGSILAVPIFYIVCDALLERATNERILKDWPTRFMWYAVIPLTYFFVRGFGALWPFGMELFLGICIVVVFSLTALALVSLTPRFERSVNSVSTIILPAFLAFICGCLLLAGTWALQTWIHTIAGI